MYLNLFTVLNRVIKDWHKTLHWLVWHFFQTLPFKIQEKIILLPFSSSVFQSGEFVFKVFKTFLGDLLLKVANFAILSKKLQILQFCPKICKFCHFVQKSAMNWREGGKRGKAVNGRFEKLWFIHLPFSIGFIWLYIMICWWLLPSWGSKQHNPN